MACKRALEEAGGDISSAVKILLGEGAKVADKKSDRELKAGVIDVYLHSTKRVGVMIEARSETDFVARNPDFGAFIHNVALHIAASDAENVEALLTEPYVKDQSVTVRDLMTSAIQKFGENIEIKRFVRYETS